MVEFSEDLSTRFIGHTALGKRVLYRLTVRKGEIPYFNGGIDISEFSYNPSFGLSVRPLLSDLQSQITFSGNRVIAGDITIEIPRSLL